MSDRSPFSSPSPVTLGESIRSRREALGLSRDELVQRIGPSMTAEDLYRIESARVLMPSWARLLLIAEALNLPLDQFRSTHGGWTNLVSADGASGREQGTESSIPEAD